MMSYTYLHIFLLIDFLLIIAKCSEKIVCLCITQSKRGMVAVRRLHVYVCVLVSCICAYTKIERRIRKETKGQDYINCTSSHSFLGHASEIIVLLI